MLSFVPPLSLNYGAIIEKREILPLSSYYLRRSNVVANTTGKLVNQRGKGYALRHNFFLPSFLQVVSVVRLCIEGHFYERSFIKCAVNARGGVQI